MSYGSLIAPMKSAEYTAASSLRAASAPETARRRRLFPADGVTYQLMRKHLRPIALFVAGASGSTRTRSASAGLNLRASPVSKPCSNAAGAGVAQCTRQARGPSASSR